MKIVKYWAVLLIALALQGCFSSDVSKAKKTTLVTKGSNFDALLETQANCTSVKWASFEDDNKRTFVKASCTLDPKLQIQETFEKSVLRDIDYTAENLKKRYDNSITELDRYIIEASNSLDFGSPEAMAAAKASYGKLKGKQELLKQGQDAFNSLVDTRRAQDIEGFRQRYSGDARVVGEFIFNVEGEAAQLVAIKVASGGETRSVPDYDSMRLLIFISQGDNTAQRTFWGGFLQPIRELMPNLLKFY